MVSSSSVNHHSHATYKRCQSCLVSVKWKEAVNTELSQIVEYERFEDKGKGATVPKDFKLIRCHFVFDVKHDGCHKARYVAGGHLTDLRWIASTLA